jgi:hypothetical protein
MTEAEWLACEDPAAMLELLRPSGQLTERKARLFAVACCRRIWRFLPDKRSRKAVEVAERYADGKADEDRLGSVCEDAAEAADTGRGADAAAHASDNSPVDAEYVAFEAAWAARRTDDTPPTEEFAAQAGLLRDLSGNPFCPAALDPAWLTWNDGVVRKLALTAYDDRSLPSGHLDPARLAVLADALEEAGCSVADILDHLRGPGPHVRGCWVVDLLLGKS